MSSDGAGVSGVEGSQPFGDVDGVPAHRTLLPHHRYPHSTVRPATPVGQPEATVTLLSGQSEVAVAATELLAGLLAEPSGQVSPSVYETARLVALAPWLTGHRSRLDFLLANQHTDGTWGGPDEYRLVPTLSATEALMAAASVAGPYPRAAVLAAAGRGLRVLFDWLGAGVKLVLPDTPAIEVIVPALVAATNARLEQSTTFTGRGRLALPAGMDGRLLDAVRARLRSGSDVSGKLLHSIEVAPELVASSPGVRPSGGTVGASPAATAAWLGERGPTGSDGAVAGYLRSAVRAHGGPVPSVLPITVFERAWVLHTLADADVPVSVPVELLNSLVASLGETGTSGGMGLPPDADTTSVALLSLAQYGVHTSLDSLWTYDVDTHFCTWSGERTPSPTTNAHVLEAFGHRVRTHPDGGEREGDAVTRISRWLCEQQLADGSWLDKWHSSGHYATGCVAAAIYRYAPPGSSAVAAVRRAVDWTLRTQRPDGGWGRWASTAEETTYALQLLLTTGEVAESVKQLAVARGYAYLVAAADRPAGPPLWHDKDLYQPVAVVRAAVLAALHLARRHPACSDRPDGLRNQVLALE